MIRTRWKIALFAFLLAGTLVLISAFVFYFYTDSFINLFLKNRIVEAVERAYPAYSVQIGGLHYNIGENRIAFDSVALATKDSTLTVGIAAYSLSGIGWLDLLWARGFVPNSLTGTTLDAHGIVVRFPKEQYEVRCRLLRISVPDSEVVVDSLKLHPLGTDNEFFAGSKFRRTRFRLVIPKARVMGLASLDLLQGKAYRTRSAHINDVFVDVLINKEKPVARDTSNPPMPIEMLASVEQILKVDSVTIWNGGLKYAERMVAGLKPAVITWDSVQVLVRGIDNRADVSDSVTITAQAEFMKSAKMNLLMSFPTSSPEFSFQYSGSVSRMKLIALNSFAESAEQMRFKDGTLYSATFAINVINGRARGWVRAVYKDLTLAAINERTGSEKGVFDVIASFIANNIKMRTNNVPGAMKIGSVKYKRQRDDPFFRFVWFALRSGVADVVGF